METNQVTYDSFFKACPSRAVLTLISDKWTMLTFCALGDGPTRFGELRRRLDGISQKVLTATLRDLERAGLVNRQVFATAPPRVDYSLTKLGRSLYEPVGTIKRWAETHIEEIAAHQLDYDERTARGPLPVSR